ncbi:hypothetical protein [Absidia glauca]|uniref:Uncharacterized protein n=1 Tax=Absidia glauca TaxID=4829 RepID=A0A168KUI8_ABSGL|nr:hypothetical protein [Absidia glauca]
MKALSFYLLITAMALIETISAPPLTPIPMEYPHVVIFPKSGAQKSRYFGDCLNLEEMGEVEIRYNYPATCRNYTDITCKNPTSDPPETHAEREIAAPKNPKGYLKCAAKKVI